MNTSKFAFLTSNRFWAIFIGAASLYLQAKGIIGDAEMAFIGTLVTGFVTVRTVDRLGDARVEAAAATEITMEGSPRA